MQRVSDRLYGRPWECWLDFPPGKPKWMRHPTYARHVEQWQQASDAREHIYGVMLLGILSKYQRLRTPRQR